MTACTQKSCSRWSVIESNSSCKYSGYQISLTKLRDYDNFEFEVIISRMNYYFFLNSLQEIIASNCNNEIELQVTFLSTMESQKTIGTILKGGQKILLPEQINAALLNELQNGLGLRIYIEDFTIEIPSQDFNLPS